MTSSSPSKDEDSFCKTAMSRREDILRSIDVTIMDRSADTAQPSSYSKTFPALRADAAVCCRTFRNAVRAMHAALPHAGLKAGISREELG